MADLTQSEPLNQETVGGVEPTHRFLPGVCFFTERIALPTGVASSELDSVIETQLEASAPFALEHLNYGAVVDASAQWAFVYAAQREMLEPILETLGPDQPAFPGFIPFLSFEVQEPCLVTAVVEQQLFLLVFDHAQRLPSEVHSLSFEGNGSDDTFIERLRADFLRDLPWLDLPLRPGLLRWRSLSTNWKNQVSFVSVHDGDERLCLELQPAQVARADVRDPGVKQKALQSARWNQLLWLGTLGSTVGLVLVMLLMGVEALWASRIEARSQIIAARQERVNTIEGKERNLQVFESGSAARLQPLAMLDIVNRARPDGIFFTEVRAYEGNHLQVDGLAEDNGTALINQFRDALNELEHLESVSVEITRINQGVAYFFRANLRFNDMELASVGAHE